MKYPEIDLNKIRLIGYGAGQHFRDYYPLIKDQLKLEYTVCPILGGQGVDIHGVEVKPPETLLQESKKNTVVVIFSASFFILMSNVRDHYGNLPCIRALDFSENDGLFAEIEDFKNSGIQPIVLNRKQSPRIGIFIQGMATEETPFVLAWNRVHHPYAYQCMVTWDHLEPKLLEKCRPWLDQLILTPQPQKTGYLYMNAGLRSARMGVEHLVSQGIEYAVRGRSDSLLKGSLHNLIEKHYARGRNKGKIAVPIYDGWPYVPFMFGTNAMVARTEDMLRFWSMSEDSREANHADFAFTQKNHFMRLRHSVPESIWWSAYAKDLGFPTESLEDSVDFFRKKILPLEPEWQSISLKFIPLFNISAHHTVTYTQTIVDEILKNPEDACERMRAIEALDMTAGDFFARRIG